MALLGSNDKYLSDLIGLGPDAQANLYELHLFGGEFGEDPSTPCCVRNAGISIPERKQSTHEVKFMTTSLNLPVASYEENKRVSINFRLDQNYDIYKTLLKEQKKVYAPSTSFVNATDIDDGFQIAVYSVDHQDGGSSKLLYHLKHCYIQSVKINGEYSYNNSSPMTITADIWYQERKDKAFTENLEIGGN